MRVASGGSSGGGSSFPPSGTLNIFNGGPGNDANLTTVLSGVSTQVVGSASDDTGKTLIMHNLAAGTFRLQGLLEDHVTGSILNLTFSGFGAIAGTFNFHILGYDTENNEFWIGANTTSGSFTAGNLYPMTISGNTITLGAGITPPALAGKSANITGSSVYNGKIVVVYHDTTNFRLDTARVYDISGASWAAPAGGTASPYAANTNATLDSNVANESRFSNGGQNDYGYFTCNHADNTPVFIRFTFSAETFSDLSSVVPVQNDSNSASLSMIALDHEGEYVIVTCTSSITGIFVFVYNATDNELVLALAMTTSTLLVSSPNIHCLCGDESNGNLGRISTRFDASSNYNSFKIPFLSVSDAGTFAGVEDVGLNSSGLVYGATNCALAYRIDAGAWQKSVQNGSLWNTGGYERLMRAYATSLEIIFLSLALNGTFAPFSPPQIYYTT